MLCRWQDKLCGAVCRTQEGTGCAYFSDVFAFLKVRALCVVCRAHLIVQASISRQIVTIKIVNVNRRPRCLLVPARTRSGAGVRLRSRRPRRRRCTPRPRARLPRSRSPAPACSGSGSVSTRARFSRARRARSCPSQWSRSRHSAVTAPLCGR